MHSFTYQLITTRRVSNSKTNSLRDVLSISYAKLVTGRDLEMPDVMWCDVMRWDAFTNYKGKDTNNDAVIPTYTNKWTNQPTVCFYLELEVELEVEVAAAVTTTTLRDMDPPPKYKHNPPTDCGSGDSLS